MNARNPNAQLTLNDLVLRCFAEQDQGGTWFAMCLDLNLYARGDSFEQARRKLHDVVHAYLRDALTTDKEHIEDLVPRKAPLYFWLKYAFIWCCVQIRNATNVRKFKEFLPVVPAV